MWTGVVSNDKTGEAVWGADGDEVEGSGNGR